MKAFVERKPLTSPVTENANVHSDSPVGSSDAPDKAWFFTLDRAWLLVAQK